MKSSLNLLSAIALTIIVVFCAWLIADLFGGSFNRLRVNAPELKQNVVVEFIDKTPMYGTRVYLKDDGIYNLNTRDAPNIKRGDTIDVTIYQHQIVKINP